MSASISTLLSQNNGRIRLLEAHDDLSREIIRNAVAEDGQKFHGIWISGLTQTTYLGIPDTELISPLKRADLIPLNEDTPILSRPLCAAYDADSGGDIDAIPALITSLAAKGVSMIIIEDKAVSEPGQKVNSLKASSGDQSQANMYEFAKTIDAFRAGAASANMPMMITARIETFTVRVVEKNEAKEKESVQAALQQALKRAKIYRSAGADAIMIHSKSALPDEVMSFLKEFRANDPVTPLVVVPTTYAQTTEEALYDAGANVIIYANHLMRAKISAISAFTEKFLVSNPDLFAQDDELSTCVKTRNYGCLLQKLLSRQYLDEVVKWYLIIAETYAIDNMSHVVKSLLTGKKCGEADQRIISVKELLKINSRQVSSIEQLG